MKTLNLIIVALLLLPSLLFSQQKDEAQIDSVDKYEVQAEQIVRFLQGTLNALGSSYTPVKEKQIMINQSFNKIFIDDKVQIEDDLDENRDMVTYKGVQAYLQDVDFFFKDVSFNYEIKGVEKFNNAENEPVYKVTAISNIKGTTISNERIDVFKDRFFEINLNEDEQTLKIASIYTTKLNVEEELNSWWNDLSPVWKTVFLEKNKLKEPLNFAQLKGVLKITELDLSGKEINSIAPLNRLSQLQKLDISNTNISDLYPLRNLNKMEVLKCQSTNVNTIDALQYMSKLRNLNIDYTKVSDIQSLENMDSLKSFSFQYTKITDLEPIAYLENIENLRLSGNKVASLTDLSEYEKVKVLQIDNTKLSSLKGIEKMKSLERISFSSTAVTDLSILKKIKSLKVVHFDSTKVASLESIEGLELNTVYCDNSGITKKMANDYMQKNKGCLVIYNSGVLMQWWNKMPKGWKNVFVKIMEVENPDKLALHRLGLITELDISGNDEIISLTPINNLIHLKKINIAKTKINNIGTLSELIELTEINCSYTGVTDLIPLSKLSNLEKLDFSGTAIRQMALTGCNKLEIIKADSTDIKGLISVANLKHLKIIYADYTKLDKAAVELFKIRKPETLVIYQTEELKKWWNLLDDNWKKIFKEEVVFNKKPSREQLGQITAIKVLDLKNNSGISSLKPLEKLIDLEEIKFSDTDVMDLVAIKNLKNLKELNCARNPIRNLAPLSALTKLETLDCSNTQIDNLEYIQNLTNIKVLKVSGTKIKNLKYLEKMHKLKHLEFSSTFVRWLKPIMELNNIKTIKCYNTKIIKIFMDKYKDAHPNVNVIF
ncbi:MAG: leucine-rich repeat domain-containing protein [Bacteroidota bacterium]